IRQWPGQRQVPIVALTASSLAEDRRACLDAGMNEVLIKPIDPAALFPVLLRLLRLQPPPAPGAAVQAAHGSDPGRQA
ncbi:MAG: hypothetical protein KBF81_09535, partial [Aquabacterium sp.]|nr:hypothetical protein [Aquabacterium sp.]